MNRYDRRIQTAFPVPKTPGTCGKCGADFPFIHMTEFYCSKCRKLPARVWKEWIDEQDRKYLKQLEMG